MTFTEYAKRFIGRPYIWGGDGSGKCFGGFDCSGFVLECLWAFGFYLGKDTTANGLLNWCKYNAKQGCYDRKAKGCLLFFGNEDKATHVAISIGNGLMIEAGGGGSKCKDLATSTGFVRIRPISSRTDLLAEYRLKGRIDLLAENLLK